MPTDILPFSIEQPPLFSTDDRIFLGEGLFETIQVAQCQPCYSFLHWRRMSQAALQIGIVFKVTYDQWQHQLMSCIASASESTNGIKVILSGGQAARGLCVKGEVSRLSFEAFTYHQVQSALKLITAGWLRDARNPIYHLKSVNYLEAILARRQALGQDADDVLFFNTENHATETSVANVYIVQENKIFMPRLDDGVLPGIIRERVLGICLASGIHCIEASIDKEMLMHADAIFITNTLQGIRFVKCFDGHYFSKEHHLVDQLRRLLSHDNERLAFLPI